MLLRLLIRLIRPAAAGTAALGIVLLLAACDRSSTATQPVKEVRGTPIQPVVGPAGTPPQGGATNPAVATASVAQPSPAAPPATSPASLPPQIASAPATGDPTSISFDQLAGYTFDISDDLLGPVTNDLATVEQKTNAQIPETVKAFNQKKVALRGFMLPLKVEGGLVTEMLIMKDQSMCCYGTTPRINDWVSVKMRNKGVRPMMDLPVTLRGTLRVGEMRENGYLVGIYSMEGEGMDAPENP